MPLQNTLSVPGGKGEVSHKYKSLIYGPLWIEYERQKYSPRTTFVHHYRTETLSLVPVGEGREGEEEEEASKETTPVAVRRLIEFKGWNVSCTGTVCSWQPRFGIVEGGAGPERREWRVEGGTSDVMHLKWNERRPGNEIGMLVCGGPESREFLLETCQTAQKYICTILGVGKLWHRNHMRLSNLSLWSAKLEEIILIGGKLLNSCV